LEKKTRELRKAPHTPGDARKLDRAVDELREVRRRRENADIQLENTEDVVDFHFEMFEFHRIRHVRTIYSSICRSQLVHGTALLDVYTPLQQHLKSSDMEPMQARKAFRDCLSSGAF